MKRARNEILDDIIDTEDAIESHQLGILREIKNVLKYTAELDNYDIEQHKHDTIQQFDLWKLEFYAKHKDSPDFPIMKSLLDNCSIISWNPHCYVAKLNKASHTLMKFYSNTIIISLNEQIFLNFNIERMNFPPCKYELFIWQFDDENIDLLMTRDIGPFQKAADKLGLSVDMFFEIIGLCYHTFMFDSENFIFKHNPHPDSKWMKFIYNKFGRSRCDGHMAFYERCDGKLRQDRLNAQKTIPNLQFTRLYDDISMPNMPKPDVPITNDMSVSTCDKPTCNIQVDIIMDEPILIDNSDINSTNNK
jgi:hypothetical protein